MVKLWWRLVRFGFRLLYNELAFTYDWVSWLVSLGAWRCWQRSALRHLETPPGVRILELAHGTGNLQLDLAALGYLPVGYDLSPYMGRIAHRKLQRHNIPVRLVRGLAQQLPFAAESFPAIICTFPTDFIFMPETLAEAHRVLQPGGQLLIVPTGALTGGRPGDKAVEWLYRITGQRGGAGIDLRAFFARYGFEAQIVQETCPRSLATVILARKQP
ncbi:MAG: methyltransferase domain-containing protein [Chloroflexi bacterium]|nr:methyltransferase domain-containing protein [Chloroflexota bacterium]